MWCQKQSQNCHSLLLLMCSNNTTLFLLQRSRTTNPRMFINIANAHLKLFDVPLRWYYFVIHLFIQWNPQNGYLHSLIDLISTKSDIPLGFHYLSFIKFYLLGMKWVDTLSHTLSYHNKNSLYVHAHTFTHSAHIQSQNKTECKQFK